ncbi:MULTISPECIES: hypothetical protein [unclassified Lysinibacillus]|uniref:hypothetical protein n=1 Tax=unclassified Lysinibacillus TaxID=2636778 RepID=UPI00380AE780
MINVIFMVVPIAKRSATMGMVITLAPATGPTIAGIIVDISSWHYIFWISIALYIIIFFTFMPKVYNVSTLTKPKIDYLSIVLSTIAFGSIIYGLSTISERFYIGNNHNSIGHCSSFIFHMASIYK